MLRETNTTASAYEQSESLEAPAPRAFLQQLGTSPFLPSTPGQDKARQSDLPTRAAPGENLENVENADFLAFSLHLENWGSVCPEDLDVLRLRCLGGFQRNEGYGLVPFPTLAVIVLHDFSCAEIEDKGDQKLFLEGAFSGVSFLPPIRFAPPHIFCTPIPPSGSTKQLPTVTLQVII